MKNTAKRGRIGPVVGFALCLSLSTWAQTSPMRLRVVGEVRANKALTLL